VSGKYYFFYSNSKNSCCFFLTDRNKFDAQEQNAAPGRHRELSIISGVFSLLTAECVAAIFYLLNCAAIKKLINKNVKAMKKSILVFGVLFVVFASCGTKKKGDNLSAPVSVIFDTDMGPDYDDAGALAMLHAMADSNECRILATVASNKHPRIAAVLNVFNTYFGRPEIPVGVPVGNAADMGAPQKWDSLITATYPHKLKSNDQAEDALKLYRRILAAEPDSSVTIVTVGFLTNMANLLASNGDELSPLDGASLIRKKVKRLVCMAGNFDDPAETFKEFNVVKDAAPPKPPLTAGRRQSFSAALKWA